MVTTDALRHKPTLEGDRVRLRPLGPQHVAAFLTDDPELRRLTGTHTEFSRDDIAAWVTSRSQTTDRLDLAIHRRDDDAYLGELALTDLDAANESVGVRIALASIELRGRGFGGEALRLVLEYAFTVIGLHRVELDVYAFNEGAVRVYERLGFRHEGRLRDALLWDGERHDALLMSMLRPEWERMHRG